MNTIIAWMLIFMLSAALIAEYIIARDYLKELTELNNLYHKNYTELYKNYMELADEYIRLSCEKENEDGKDNN